MNKPVSGTLSRETLTTALLAITADLETLANGAAIQHHKIAAAEIRALLNGQEGLGSDPVAELAPDFVASLRLRYTSTPVPPCRVCGGVLHVAKCGGGKATVYACKGATREDNSTDCAHYEQSQFMHRNAGDDEVIAFIDAATTELERTKRFMNINAESAQAKHLEALRYRDERDALRMLLVPPMGIGRLINSQDNSGTDQPLFAVMEKRGMVTLETHDHDRIEWYHSENVSTADDRTALRLEAIHAAGREVKGWERYAVKDIDLFVTACFTEQGCIDFLARDGHNHTKPFICAFGSYRNGEYQKLRDWLKSLPATQNAETQL
ncbi:hypothetical protein [Pseudomonas sp. PS02290]|uniref:hypothetical protein n=1 Tax=Pseudomonas sp. PS02290 TaxID=2991430 RepID=UPI00249BF664|nr:hypothetical protein [Pseudomonas sp. PS02290]